MEIFLAKKKVQMRTLTLLKTTGKVVLLQNNSNKTANLLQNDGSLNQLFHFTKTLSRSLLLNVV